MSKTELHFLPGNKIIDLIHSKEISAREVAEVFSERIETTEPKVDAFLHNMRSSGLEAADLVDKAISTGVELQALAGLPVGIKDNMCMNGVPTTCASKILENYVPVYTSTAVQKLMDGQVAVLGKTNMDEFAFGSSTENSAFKVTRNPWDTDRVPGGSSGGSAAAVAAGMVPVALGSDTGGSIRQPAALCGVVGMKPTYGRVSRYGLVAFASSLDQIGPITKDVKDSAMVLTAISGHDRLDSTSLSIETPDFTSNLNASIKGLKIGVIKELTGYGLEPGVKENFDRAVKKFEENGAFVEEISMPSIKHSTSAYYLIGPAEASSNLARFDGVRYGVRVEGSEIVETHKKTRGQGFGEEAKRRIMLGTYALSAGYYDAYYGQAQKVRTLIINEFNGLFSKYDVLMSPTSPTTAFKIGEKTTDPLSMYLSDVCTIAVNLAGIPAISVPCGLSEGLPVGLQIMGKQLDEQTVLNTAFAYEQLSGHIFNPGL